MSEHLKKFQQDQTEAILEELEVSDELSSHLQAMDSDMQMINTLIENEEWKSACTFLALGLPKREAIWWSYLAAHEIEHNAQCLKTQSALKSVFEWVHDPSEENRLKTESLANALELYTPASWAAMAVFWSGDNISPQGRPIVKPDVFMSGHAVANAVNLSAEYAPDREAHYRHVIKQGLHIAMGGNGKV